jgi:hypothetical protein
MISFRYNGLGRFLGGLSACLVHCLSNIFSDDVGYVEAQHLWEQYLPNCRGAYEQRFDVGGTKGIPGEGTLRLVVHKRRAEVTAFLLHCGRSDVIIYSANRKVEGGCWLCLEFVKHTGAVGRVQDVFGCVSVAEAANRLLVCCSSM